jgi:single stranded DNA-binding protein
MINRIVLMGNTTRDAETKLVGKNTVTEFSLAVNHGKDIPASFFRVSAWDKWTAEHPPKKGDKVIVDGSLRLREFEKKDGSTGFSAEIRADRVTVTSVKAPEEVDF